MLHAGQLFCNRCIRWKPTTEFYPHKNTSCKACEQTRVDQWRANNQEKTRTSLKAWRANNQEKSAAISKRAHLKRTYNLSIEAHMAMLQMQFYKCASCERKFDSESKMMAVCVDHDHETNEVRGLLCHYCNLIIRYANEDVKHLEGAIAYLKRYGK